MGDDLEEAEAKAEQESLARREKFANGNVFNFYFSKAETKAGAIKPIIILDLSWKHAVGFAEHSIKNQDGTFDSIPCVKDLGVVCAGCSEAEKPKSPIGYASFIVKMSILDLTPYTIPAGKENAGKVIPVSKKILQIKPNSRKVLKPLFDACMKQNGTCRGMYMEMVRDATDSQSASIGSPQQLEIKVDVGGRTQVFFSAFDFIPESDLNTYLLPAPEMSKDGKTVQKPVDYYIRPFDYAKIFPEPDPAAVNRKLGVTPVGSASDVAKQWGTQPATPPSATTPDSSNGIRSRLRTQAPAGATTTPAISTPTVAHSAPVLSQEEQFEQAGAVGVIEENPDDDIPFGDAEAQA